MTKHTPPYDYDISLNEGVGARLVGWITALMVFFVTLALALNFALSTVAKTWVTGLSGTLTVEIMPPLSATDDKVSPADQKRFETSVDNVLAMLKNNSAVTDARLLGEAEIKNLIAPWMGRDAALEGLPLPALIDIRLAPGAETEKLTADLKAAEPSATLDTASETLDNVKGLIRAATLFMLLLTGVIVALAVVTISGIVRSKFLLHLAEVETLHLIGASDEYIARQFRRHTLRGTIRGALGGVIATVLVLLALGAVTHNAVNALFPHLQIMPLQWLAVLLVPVFTGCIISHLTAQTTVLKELARLP